MNVLLVSLSKHIPIPVSSISLCKQALVWCSSLLSWSLQADLQLWGSNLKGKVSPINHWGPIQWTAHCCQWKGLMFGECVFITSSLSAFWVFFPKAQAGLEAAWLPRWDKAAEQPWPHTSGYTRASLLSQSKAFTLFCIFISSLQDGKKEENKIIIAADVIFTI